jgi:hypothetical protein
MRAMKVSQRGCGDRFKNFRMGKIVKEKFPNLDEDNQEAVWATLSTFLH